MSLIDEAKIIEGLVIVEITDYEDEKYWYKDMVGEKLIAFGISDDNAVWCCHKNNTNLNVATINDGHYKIIQGDKKRLWSMD